MGRGWKFSLLLLIVGMLCQCATFKKTSKRARPLRKLSHVGRLPKASQPKNENGQKKNAMQSIMQQPSHDQVAAMQNPEGLQASETDIINHLQNYNKHYLNNEMAAETALLADNGIDDDSALKISNMAALPNGLPHHGLQVANAAIKAKISSSVKQVHGSTDHQQASTSPGGYDPNAYLNDANSWPEYSIHDSDYSNFHAVEMNNINGENTDMPPMYNKPNMYDKPDESPEMGFQNMGSEGGMEYLGDQKSPQGKAEGGAINDEVKEAEEEALQNEKIEEDHPQESSEDKSESSEDKGENTKAPGSSDEMKPADSSEASGDSKAQGDAKAEAQNSQQLQQKEPENIPPAQIKDAASPKQQNGPQPQVAQLHQQQQQQQQQPQQQQPQQDKSTSSKLTSAAVAKAAAVSLPPKALASLLSRLKAVGITRAQSQGQIQKNGSSFQAHIPQDINPAKEMAQSAAQRLSVMRLKTN